MTIARTLGRFWPVVVLLGLVAAVFMFHLDRYLSIETLRANREALQDFVAGHGFLAGLGFLSLYAVVVALSLPGAAVMTISGGFLFGTWLGGGLSMVGATIGATLLFLTARSAFGDGLRQRAGPFLQGMAAGFQRNAFNYLMFLRLVPAFPFWAVNLVPGLLDVWLAPFVIATALGIIPGSLAYAALGAGLGQAFDSGAEVSLSGVFSPTLLAALIGLGVLALVPVAFQRFRGKRLDP